MNKVSVDSSPSLIVDSVVLPKSTWEFSTPEEGSIHAPDLISYVPGTWIERLSWMNPRLLAAFCCPNCRGIRYLVKGIHTIDHLGLVKPDISCKNGPCTFHRKVYLDRWNKKPLYASAIERIVNGKIVPEIHHTHATTPQEAAFHLGQGNYKIVAIGPAIGFKVADGKDDTKLIA